MKIIEQSHEIISLPDNLLQTIEAAGRTCYQSEDKIGCAGEKLFACKYRANELSSERVYYNCDQMDCEHHSSQKFVKMLRDRGHHAMIEFGDIIVRLVTNRGVSHELVRHRLCSFAQESTRYVRYDGKMEFIKPVWCSDELIGINLKGLRTKNISNQELKWLDACYNAECCYLSLLEDGWRPEQAREVLPNSLKTEIVVKANVREFRHILDLRCNKKAHPQIRALILPLLKEVHGKIPVIFDDLYDKYIGQTS